MHAAASRIQHQECNDDRNNWANHGFGSLPGFAIDKVSGSEIADLD